MRATTKTPDRPSTCIHAISGDIQGAHARQKEEKTAHADCISCSCCQRRDCAESRGENSSDLAAPSGKEGDCRRPVVSAQQSNNLIAGNRRVGFFVFMGAREVNHVMSAVYQDLPFTSQCRQDTAMTHVDV